MENKSHAFMAGLFAIVLGAATLLALYWLGGKNTVNRTYVVVTRQNVTGLNPQAQVRYRGIRVGKVTNIQLDPKDARDILVTIQVGEDVPITKGTVAKLAYQGVTGLAHVFLEDNGSDATPLLPGAHGEAPRIAMTPSLFEEVSQSGAELLEEAKNLMVSAKAMLNDENRKKVAAILAHLESASGQMKPTLESANATLTQVRALLADENVRKLSHAAGEVGPLLSEARQAIARLRTTADHLDAAIGQPAAGGAAALMPRLDEMAADVSSTARQLNRVLKAIENSPQSLVFGAPTPQPGPGEPGFAAPATPSGEKP